MDTEQRIIEVAKQVFIEKGYEEVNMSYIAQQVGINRPALHYYFRTKDKLYEAVYGKILSGLIPAVKDTLRLDKPLRECIAEIVDIYFNTIERTPGLPLFIAREVQRDPERLLNAVKSNSTIEYATLVKSFVLHNIETGKMKDMPLLHFFYTFIGLVIAPFLSMPLTNLLFDDDEHQNKKITKQWKERVINMLLDSLCIEE